VINRNRSERGWRGRRRIAVLASVAGVLGVAALTSAGAASATTVADCHAKLEPSGKAEKLSFVCDNTIRAYTVASNKQIKGYGQPSAGSATGVLTCEGRGVGFGCGVPDRAAPGTQPVGTTGWTVVPPYPAGGSKSDKTPLTCDGYKRVQGDLGQPKNPSGPPDFPPTLNAVVTPPCTQIVPAGTKVAQKVSVSNPCAAGKDPLQVFLLVGGEPNVTSFTAGNSIGPGGESTTVGEYLQAPIPVNLKAFKGCQNSGGGAKKSATKSAAAATKFPVACGGSISPSATLPGVGELTFQCSQTIRAFAVYSNKPIDLPGDEPVVTGTGGGGLGESAVHQCEGSIPGPGYGCGVVDRQSQTVALPNGNSITAGNMATQRIGFESNPCKGSGTKAWFVAMGEPTIGSTVGEFSSQPFRLGINYGKCKGGGKKKK
jgi:hypothetical protein